MKIIQLTYKQLCIQCLAIYGKQIMFFVKLTVQILMGWNVSRANNIIIIIIQVQHVMNRRENMLMYSDLKIV